MQVPGLAKNGHYGSIRINEGLNIAVVFNPAVLRVSGASKSRHPGMLQRQLRNSLEERHVLEVRSGPTTFNVVDAKLVQLVRNVELVINRKGDVFALRTVTQRRVVNLDFFHGKLLSAYSGQPQLWALGQWTER